MRSVVTIIFNARQTLELPVEVASGGANAEAAREWFDMMWSKLGCEPLRASGKVLLLDKIMGVADALGYSELSEDQALARDFASQATLALDKSRVTVDLPGLVVAF